MSDEKKPFSLPEASAKPAVDAAAMEEIASSAKSTIPGTTPTRDLRADAQQALHEKMGPSTATLKTDGNTVGDQMGQAAGGGIIAMLTSVPVVGSLINAVMNMFGRGNNETPSATAAEAGEKATHKVGEHIKGSGEAVVDAVKHPGQTAQKAQKAGKEALESANKSIDKVRKSVKDDGVVEGLKKSVGGADKGELAKKGAMVGGAAIAADGFRRMAKKDAEGNRDIKRGATQVALGAGTFAAGVLASRAGKGNDGPTK